MGKKKINDLAINLAYVERARIQNSSIGNWELGKHTLEFLQKMKVIKYREARELISIFKSFPVEEELFLIQLKRELSSDVEHIRVTHIVGDDPFKQIGAWPMKGIEIVQKKTYREKVINQQTPLSQAYKEFIGSVEHQSKLSAPLYEWLYEKFDQGVLEKEIQNYLSWKEKSRPSKAFIPKAMISKLSGKRDRPEEVLPTFNVAEMDVLHVAFYKSQNMTKKESEILAQLDPNANRETDSHFKVVIARSEALNMCYMNGARDNQRRINFFTAAESLTKKTVTWVLDKDDGGYLLHKEPVIRPAFVYELSKEGLEEGRYFCLEIPKKLLNKIKGNYFKSLKDERLKLRSIPPKLSAAQEKFVLHLKTVAPINNRSKREFKWEATKWAKRLWGEDKVNLIRNLVNLEEFGKKQVLLGFLASFSRVEEPRNTFFCFTFPKYCKYQ